MATTPSGRSSGRCRASGSRRFPAGATPRRRAVHATRATRRVAPPPACRRPPGARGGGGAPGRRGKSAPLEPILGAPPLLPPPPGPPQSARSGDQPARRASSPSLRAARGAPRPVGPPPAMKRTSEAVLDRFPRPPRRRGAVSARSRRLAGSIDRAAKLKGVSAAATDKAYVQRRHRARGTTAVVTSLDRRDDKWSEFDRATWPAISTKDVSQVDDCRGLFAGTTMLMRASFNDDISAWDTSAADDDVRQMFFSTPTSFNSDDRRVERGGQGALQCRVYIQLRGAFNQTFRGHLNDGLSSRHNVDDSRRRKMRRRRLRASAPATRCWGR